MSEWKEELGKQKCDTCRALEVELGLAKNEIIALKTNNLDLSARWAAANSLCEAQRMTIDSVKKTLGVK